MKFTTVCLTQTFNTSWIKRTLPTQRYNSIWGNTSVFLRILWRQFIANWCLVIFQVMQFASLDTRIKYCYPHLEKQDRLLGSFSNDDGDGSENVTIKMNYAFSNVDAIIPTRIKNIKCRWNFPEVEFFKTAPKFRKRKNNSSSCVYVLHKTSLQKISRPSRAVTAKKYTKKCTARAEFLFWLLSVLLFWRSHWRCRRCC